MRRSWASVTVGLLVVIVGVISYFLIHSTSERSSSSQGYTVWGLFRDASGVFEKSRVQTAGIAIGQIEGRVLDPSGKARITIRLKPGIKIYENAVVAKKSASLLGEFYLEIDPGTDARIVDGVRQPTRILKEGDQIKDVREPTAMGDIIDEVGTLMPIMHDILEDVHKLTSGRITDIAENVNKLIETNSEVLERLLNRVDHIAADVEGVTTAEAGDVKESLKNVREITESIKGLIGTTKGSVADTTGAVRGTIDRLQTTIASLDHTMKNLDEISSRVDKGEGTVGTSSTTTRSRATWRTSRTTRARSSTASRTCRRSWACAPSTTSCRAPSRTTSRCSSCRGPTSSTSSSSSTIRAAIARSRRRSRTARSRA